MIIKIVRQVNSRWHDGRVLSAMEGTIRTIDDEDTDAVDHARHIIATGDAIDITDGEPAADDAPEQDTHADTGEQDANTDDGTEPASADKGSPAPAKKAAARARKATAGAAE